MLLSVARHRRFYENICIFFSWIIGFSHFYMCFCISFFFLFFFLNTIANLREEDPGPIFNDCPPKAAEDIRIWKNTLSSRKDGWIIAAILSPDIHECNADGWRLKKKKRKSGFLWLMRSWRWGSLLSNCSVFVLSFCQSILLSRDLCLEWVWGKMTINYKWWL